MAPIGERSPLLEEDLDAAGFDVLHAVVRALEDLALTCGDVEQRMCFDASRKPEFPLQDYAHRISHFFRCSESCYGLSMVYLDRVVRNNPQFVVTERNVHRLLLSSIVVATKFNDDHYYSNDFYSKVGGVPTKELNVLEAEFIRLLDWRLRVTREEYLLYLGRAQSHDQGLRLGRARQGFGLAKGCGGGSMETAMWTGAQPQTATPAVAPAALAVAPRTSSDVASGVGATAPPGPLGEDQPMQVEPEVTGNEKAPPTHVACMAEAYSRLQGPHCARRRRPSSARRSSTPVPLAERRSSRRLRMTVR